MSITIVFKDIVTFFVFSLYRSPQIQIFPLCHDPRLQVFFLKQIKIMFFLLYALKQDYQMTSSFSAAWQEPISAREYPGFSHAPLLHCNHQQLKQKYKKLFKI